MRAAVIYWLLVAALLGFQAAVMVTSALQETQTYDEGVHLAAGYAYLKTGEYQMNCEHPPLGKLLAAATLLPLRPHVPLDDVSWKEMDQREFARAFLYKNHVPADVMLFRARLVTMLATLCLGLALVIWTRRHFGAGAGLLAVFLFALDPNLTAHGRYVTNDVLLSLCMFLAVIAWGAWLENGKRRHLLWAALAVACGLVSKFSALFLFPLFVALYVVRWRQRRGSFGWRRLVSAVLVLVAFGVAVIGACYWRETKRLTLGGHSQFVSLSDRIERLIRRGGFLYDMGRRFPLPAYSYLLGLDAVVNHDADGHPAYLLGQWSEKGGWWYYFPVAFGVKTPTAVLLLAALGLVLALWKPGRLRRLRFAWYLLALPPAAYFLLWMRSHVNIGLRHILPVYPFLFVLAAAAVLRGWPQRWRRGLVALLCGVTALQAYESLRIYPHYLAFFNLPSGGPVRGPDYLVDSNIDWGQDLKKLKAWHEAHGKPRLCLAYFGQADLHYYKVEAAEDWLPPTWDTDYRKVLDCVAAISVTVLKDVYRFPGEFEWLRKLRPIDQVGHSIYIYDLRKGRAAR